MHKTIEIVMTKEILEDVLHDLIVSNNGMASFIREYKALVKHYKNDETRIDGFKSTLKWAKKKHKEKALLIEQLRKQKEEFNG